MNKQQEFDNLNNEIKELLLLREELKTELNNLETEKPIKPGYEWLEKGVRYWLIDSFGLVTDGWWNNRKMDYYRLNHNNVFQTEEEAQKFKDIETKIYEIQNKNPVDWDDNDQLKYTPDYSLPLKLLDYGVVNSAKCSNSNHYSTDKNFILEIKASISSDDIDFYFRRV